MAVAAADNVGGGIGNAAAYIWGQCTYFVASLFAWVPAGLGNAGDWLGNAQRMGIPTGKTPQAGSVVVYAPGHGYSQYGHVAAVTGVNRDGTFTVSEMNYQGPNKIDTRTSTMSDVAGFIYNPNGHSGNASTAAPGSANARAIAPDILIALDTAINPPPSSDLLGLGSTFQMVSGRAVVAVLGFVVVGVGLWLLFGNSVARVVSNAEAFPVPV